MGKKSNSSIVFSAFMRRRKGVCWYVEVRSFMLKFICNDLHFKDKLFEQSTLESSNVIISQTMSDRTSITVVNT